MEQFYAWLGAKEEPRVRLAVMDMWKPFRNCDRRRRPRPRFYSKVPHHASSRRGARQGPPERIRPARGKGTAFIKGQKYTLLSRRENLTLEGKKSLRNLLAANKRLNTAYLLKESFGQLWGYEREGWARRFFENWRASLKWQRLKPYEKFAAMIDRHWDGIAAYCRPENKFSLGLRRGAQQQDPRDPAAAYGCETKNTSGSRFSPACAGTAASGPSPVIASVLLRRSAVAMPRNRDEPDRTSGNVDKRKASPSCPQPQQE